MWARVKVLVAFEGGACVPTSFANMLRCFFAMWPAGMGGFLLILSLMQTINFLCTPFFLKATMADMQKELMAELQAQAKK